jgi:hypothetical protein
MSRTALVGLLCILISACADRELDLMPVGFEGPVIIIFNDPNGAPARWERGARRYDIPASGVFRTQFSPNEGWGRPDYEYVDASGHRSLIVPGTPCVDSLLGDPVQACLDAVRGPGPRYDAYVVSHRANRKEMYDRGARLVDSVLFGGSIWGRHPN